MIRANHEPPSSHDFLGTFWYLGKMPGGRREKTEDVTRLRVQSNPPCEYAPASSHRPAFVLCSTHRAYAHFSTKGTVKDEH
jgi:hypothetical protein